ncbi:hypothetical protein GWK47_039941 [Chionoecetes opilio]|uniref:Uncharacterized protein n=1 Tax=Chionoecetes opilio TaxID=41210 RepID=A0A8J4YCG7_CHIOP|nr:hypothetical protein GWK47_039941 [Chionoecetes opilio]
MHKFSLGISYKDILNLYDAWAKFDIETNRACPDELAMGQPGTTVMDNGDFKDDNLTGANTSHRTNVMFVQPQDLMETSAVSRQSLNIPTTDDMKALCASQHLVQPYKTVQRGTPSIRLAANIDAPYERNMQRKRSLIHVLAHLNENMKPRVVSEQTVGAFVGFQASVQPSVVKSKPIRLPP